MSYSPTVIAASLSDAELKQSINNLVQYVEDGTKQMSQSFTDAVSKMKEQLKSLGSTSFGTGGGSDSSSSRMTKNQRELTTAVDGTTTSVEKLTSAMQKAAESSDKQIFSTIDTQIAIFKEELKQAEKQVQSFTEMARAAAVSGDKGLFVFATKNLHEQEDSVARLKRQIEELTDKRAQLQKVTAPQGDAIKNFVQDLQKANPELQKLNEQYRSGNALLQQKDLQLKKTAQEEQEIIDAERKRLQQSQDRIAKENDYAATTIQRQQELRSEIINTGLAAQDASNKIIKSMHEQTGMAGNDPIKGVKDLELAIKQMNSAYWQLSDSEKISPIGLALEADIKRAQQALIAVHKYNQSLSDSSRPENQALNNKSSIDSLRQSLKLLTSQYNSMTVAEINAGKADNLIQKFQDINRASQLLQRQLSKPLSLNAVRGLQERHLDDILYKMQQLQSYRAFIDITKPGAKDEIAEVNNELTRLQKKQSEIIGQNKTLLESNNALARSWNYMKNRLAFYFTVGASTQFVKNLIDIRAQYEMNERALGILINSAERGSQIFQELSNMALISPYTVIELTAAAKQLTAYGVAARDVTETTRRLADMASAVGVPMERLTYALGQIKAYGYLNSRDNRMFANAGIPLVKELADYYTQLEGKLVSTADVYDRIKKKAVDYNDVIQVINKMTDEGGKFFDFQAKMADTLKVRLANLNLAWNNMLNDIGKNTQGILTWTIGALRDLFLHWKEFDSAVWSLFWAGGLIVGFRALNVLLVKSGFQWRILSKEMTAAQIAGAGVERRFLGIKSALGALVKSPLTWWSLLAFAIVDVTRSIINMDEAQKQLNESIRKGAEDNYNNVSQFLSNYQKLRDSLYVTTNGKTTPQNIDKSEASKAWESIREQIELTVKNADEYIGKLLSIQNISERVRQGFNLLDDIQTVNAALNELDKDSIKISDDFRVLGMSISDGLVQDLKGFIENEKGVIDTYGSIESARKVIEEDGKKDYGFIYDNYKYSLRELQREVDKTTQSILNFIEIKGWSGDTNKINLAFSQILEKVALEKNLSPKEYFNLQVEAESARTEALKQALKIRIDTERTELAKARKENEKAAIRERLNTLNTELRFLINNTDESKVYWNNFIKWMGSQHKSEVQRMFKDMTSEEIKALDFSKGSWKKWVDELVAKYAKEHKMGIDEVHKHLKNFIYNANQYSIRIPLIISSEGVKSEFETLSEADSALDAALNKIERLNKRRSELKKQGASMAGTRDIDKEYAKTLEEIASAEKDAADARAKGGHSKNEEKERTKQQKQAESELQKALKSELQLIEKVSSAYNELTKSGTTHFDAIKKSTEGFDESVANINKVLNKYGLNFDLSKFAGTQNPREIVKMLQQQIDTLLKNPNAKPAEIQDLQVEVQKLNLKVETFDQKTLTDSLNNKLSKLKDEYELAVELDANPELGDLFTNMFDIDTRSFPHTISEYMQRVQDDFNNEIDKRGWNLSINVFKANAEVWKQWGDAIGLSKEALDQFKAKFVEAQGVAEKKVKDIITQTKQLEYELGDVSKKIEIEQDKLSKLYADLFKATQNDDVQSAKLLELQIEKQKQTIDKLRAGLLEEIPEYAKVFNSIAEHSSYMTRRLINDLRKIYDAAKKNADDTYTITGSDGKTAILSRKEFDKAYEKLTKEARKAQAPFDKIHKAFTKDEDGVIDYAKGIELVSTEVQKLGTVASEVGNLAQILGANEETVEIINDVAASLNGVASVGQGITQIANKDYIGGAASILSGIVGTISSWFDNSDKKIQSMIKDSELAVKRLEVSYKNLQNAEEDAFGTAVMGAQQAMKANRELQLVELKRQLALEQRRDGKHRDEERIASLRGEIIDLEHEIAKATLETFNNLADISSFGDLFQSMIDEMIDAFKQGEDAMKVFSEKWDAMIDSLVGKMIYQQIVSVLTKDLEKVTQGVIEKYTKNISKSIAETQEHIDYLRSIDPGDISEWIYENDNAWFNQILQNLGFSESFNATPNKRMWFNDAWNKGWLHQIADAYFQMLQNSLNVLNDESEKASLEATKELIPTLTEWGKTIQEGGYLQDIFDRIQDIVTPSNNAQLSALQQGIQGITEDTAGALEAYMNGVSQQVYLHSDLLTQIRDAVIGFNMDASLGVQSQMLFELQQSYAVQTAIKNILGSWSSANGLAVKVEMV